MCQGGNLFMGLFAPGWKSTDTRKACASIAKLRDGNQKQEIIREILNTDQRLDVRIAALRSVQKDPEFLKEIYRTFDDDTIRSYVFSFLSDSEFKKETLLSSGYPRYWMIMYLQGEKEFAYDLLSGRKKIRKPDERFWAETVRIIKENYGEADKEKLLEIVYSTDCREMIRSICGALDFHHEKDALIRLAGTGLIGPKQFFDGRKVTWDTEDYIKKCARELLVNDGYTSDEWNKPLKKG